MVFVFVFSTVLCVFIKASSIFWLIYLLHFVPVSLTHSHTLSPLLSPSPLCLFSQKMRIASCKFSAWLIRRLHANINAKNLRCCNTKNKTKTKNQKINILKCTLYMFIHNSQAERAKNHTKIRLNWYSKYFWYIYDLIWHIKRYLKHEIRVKYFPEYILN